MMIRSHGVMHGDYIRLLELETVETHKSLLEAFRDAFWTPVAPSSDSDDYMETNSEKRQRHITWTAGWTEPGWTQTSPRWKGSRMKMSEPGSNEVSDFTGTYTVTSLHYQFSPNPDRKNYIDGFSLILRDATILSKMDISRGGGVQCIYGVALMLGNTSVMYSSWLNPPYFCQIQFYLNCRHQT